jgi:hypothetical protein
MGYQGSDIPNQETGGEHLLGTGYSIEGIPLEDDMPQLEKTSATPNRDDTDFNVQGDLESDYAVDYFDAEEDRLGDPLEANQPDNERIEADERWSEGINDEANEMLEEYELAGDQIDENALPEMGPIDVIEKPTLEQLDPSTSDRYITED